MDYSSQSQPMIPSYGRKSNLMWIVIGLACVFAIAAAIWFFAGGKSGRVLGANTTSAYQAVFLTNGQVYFGKLRENGNWIDLSDIFYLQVTQNLQAAASGDSTTDTTPASTSTDKSNIQLVKLGSELHGPEDVMHIDRDKVLFWEDMKDDSKVVAAIKQYKAK